MVFGGIDLSKNMKAFLSLPLKFRVYPKPDRLDFETQIEGRKVRTRWRLREKIQHPNETHESYRARKEDQEEERQPLRGKKVNFTKVRVTDLLSNKLIYMPRPAANRDKILIGSEGVVLLDVWDLYMDSNTSDNGHLKGANNLTRKEAMGRDEIRRGIKEKGWLLYGCDKSGKLCSDTLDNFHSCMEEHYAQEIKSNIQNVHDHENNLNNHSKSWATTLKFGSEAGDGQHLRIQGALKVNKSTVPKMMGLRKDHKVYDDFVRGPKLRALVNGKVGPNSPLANLLTRLFVPVRFNLQQKVDTEILSTEELLHHVENFNSSRDAQNLGARRNPSRGCKTPPLQSQNVCIGSMDVKALFPNCKSRGTCIAIKEAFQSCDLEFESVDKPFLLKFVSILMRGDSGDRQLNQFLQTPKNRTTLNSYLKRRAESQFLEPPEKPPNDLQAKDVQKLLGLAAAKSTDTVMKSHFFSIKGGMYKQRDGETLLQEGLRRLRNCSIDTEVNVVSEIMSQYMYQLHISGYDLKFRHTILKGILDRREKLNQNVANGIWTRFRSKNEILEQKKVRLGKYPATWFLKGGKVNTLKVIPTPNSELKNKISNTLNSLDYLADGGPTRVIELGGNLISRGMGGTENFGGKGSCHMGASCFTDPEHDCRSSRAVHSNSCDICQGLNPPRNAQYVGTTGRCTHSRMLEHQKAVQNSQRSNALAKHQQAKHSNLVPNFKAKILRGGVRFNTDRFVLEALHIRDRHDNPNVDLLNQKGEWGYGGIPRLLADN